jgi:hypothetical protein
MSHGESPGEDSIPPEIYKEGDKQLVRRLLGLFLQIWDTESVPQDFKDASIVHIFKRTSDRACCDDHRGISLLPLQAKYSPVFYLISYQHMSTIMKFCQRVTVASALAKALPT